MSKSRPAKPSASGPESEAPQQAEPTPARKKKRRARGDSAGRRALPWPKIALYAGAPLLLLLAGYLLVAYWPLGDSQHAEVEEFLERYFATWSAGDMAAYEACFHPQAIIFFVDQQRRVHPPDGVQAFVRAQTAAQSGPSGPQTEVAESMDIQIVDDTAQAQVRWRLQRAEGDVYGTDYFTLIHDDHGWQIISLAFQEDRKP